MAARFYAPDLNPSQQVARLPADEAHHLVKVLRLAPGAIVGVFDGRGNEWRARVETAGRDGVEVSLLEPVPAQRPAVDITLVQAVLKGEPMDDVVRDCTMVGVAALQPVLTARTTVKTSVTLAAPERWRRIALASAKQCGAARLPDIGEVMTLRGLARITRPFPVCIHSRRTVDGRRRPSRCASWRQRPVPSQRDVDCRPRRRLDRRGAGSRNRGRMHAVVARPNDPAGRRRRAGGDSNPVCHAGTSNGGSRRQVLARRTRTTDYGPRPPANPRQKAYTPQNTSPSSHTTALLFRGQTLGKYKIIAPLGSGGFGTVYLAQDTWIDKKVAIKVPHRQGLDFGELLREPRLLASVSHPNIVVDHHGGEAGQPVLHRHGVRAGRDAREPDRRRRARSTSTARSTSPARSATPSITPTARASSIATCVRPTCW